MVSCEPNPNTVAFDEQKQRELSPRVSEVRLRACPSAGPKQNSSSGIEILIIFNVSPSRHKFGIFMLFSAPVWATVYFCLFVSIHCVK